MRPHTRCRLTGPYTDAWSTTASALVRGGVVPRVPADALRCQIVFAETCTGIGVTDSVVPGNLSLALGALEGLPSAYLSSTKVMRTTGIAPILATALLESGLPFGETASIITLSTRRLPAMCQASFYLAMPPHDSDRRGPRRRFGFLNCRIPAHSPSISATIRAIVRIDIEGAVAEAFADDPDLVLELMTRHRPSPQTPRCLSMAIGPGPGFPLSILLFSPWVVRLSALTLAIRSKAAVHGHKSSELAGSTEHISNGSLQRQVASVTGYRATPQRKKHAVDLQAVLTSAEAIIGHTLAAFNGALSRGRELPHVAREELVLGELCRSLDAIDSFLVAAWPSWDMPHYQVPLYSHILHANGKERHARACYLCGSQTFDLVFESYVRPDLTRVLTHCTHCDILFDRGGDEPFVEIHGDSGVQRGMVTRQILRVRNDQPVDRQYGASASVEGSYPWFQATITPSSQIFTVPANSERGSLSR